MTRVVVWGINYSPELTGIAPYNVALCEFLRARGHDAEMITTFAYYPSWRKRIEDQGCFFRTDMINGVPVFRCWHFVPAQVSAGKRILHEASFVFTSTIRALARPRADVYVIVSPPLLLGAAAWLVGLFKRAPFVFHVQDLQPDAAVGLGMLKHGWFTRALFWLERFAYRKAARVSGIGEGMLEAFRRKGVPDHKLIYFPNGVVLPELSALPRPGEFRKRHEIAPGDFLAVYAGNLGVKQGLRILIEAAQLLIDTAIRIVICGDGAERDLLLTEVRERRLENVLMLPLLPAEAYAELLVDADVCLITQQAGSGNSFFPSKLLSTLAYAKPVVSVADPASALARSVAEGNFGVNVPTGEAQMLASALRDLASDRKVLEQFGPAGRIFVQRFDQQRVLENFLRELESLGRGD